AATLQHLFYDAACFVLKTADAENVTFAKTKGVWSIRPSIEQKLNRAFRDHRSAILFVSVNQSGAFQGFARMSSKSRRTTERIPWILPTGIVTGAFSSVFDIDWIT
ncbi:unnamed protein product, partial [Rotaria sp. Silwood1]